MKTNEIELGSMTGQWEGKQGSKERVNFGPFKNNNPINKDYNFSPNIKESMHQDKSLVSSLK